MTRVLGIGECMIEMAPDEAPGTYRMGFAGDTFNTCWYMRRIAGPEVSVGYLSAIGDDDPSARMAQFMTEAGIEPHLAVRPGGTVGLYMISLVDGERSFSYWRSAAAARTLADGLERLPGLGAGDLAYVSGITLAILPDAGREALLAALAAARAEGVTVAFDPNLRPRLWTDAGEMRRWIMAGAERADIALPSHEDEATHFGDESPAATADRYAAAGARMVAVKNADCPVLVRDGDARAEVRPERVAQVADTTAAGDSFNAAFLIAHLSGAPAEAAARAGCRIAAQVVSARGALVEVTP